VHIIQLN